MDQPTFGDLLARYRRAAGLTQEELAERAGLSARGVSDLERGLRQRPYPETLRLLADALALAAPERARLETVGRSQRDPVSQVRGASPAPPRHNLPRQLTSFVGREVEVAEVAALLDTAALVTLSGVGGTGKTRLALAVAERVIGEYPDGVWLVEIAPLADPTLVPPTVATALGVHEQPVEPLPATLVAFLAPRRALLLLDNCEHLIDACAHLAEQLLTHCPELRILATSREALGVPGEVPYRVPSLQFPADGDAATAATLAEAEAVRLFVARARAARPGFALTDASTATVAQICARLDGIPLALELAAARLRALPLEQLAERLADRFRLLTSGSRTALPRQQTLQATLDWSYRLLEGDERSLLRRLGVFAGSWTLEAAEAVCVGTPLEAWQVLDLLTRLVDKSLVILDDGSDAARYRLLETVRQYALERLLDADEAAALRARHAAWCQALVAREAPQTVRGAQVAAFAALDAELDNVRQALAWYREHDAEAGLRLAGGFWPYWAHRGLDREGRDWLTGFLAAPGSADQVRAAALAGLSTLMFNLGELRACLPIREEVLELYRALHDRTGEAQALRLLGIPTGLLGDWVRARQLNEAALTFAQAVGDQWGIGLIQYYLGPNLHILGEHDRGLALLETGLRALQAAGDRVSAGVALTWLGVYCAECGDRERASAAFAEARAINQQFGSSILALNLAWHEGRATALAGDHVAALSLLDEGLLLCRKVGSLRTAELLAALGLVRGRLGERHGARQALTEGLVAGRRIGYHGANLRCLEAAALVLGGERWTAPAVRLLGATAAERVRRAIPLPPVERTEEAAALAAARAALGDAAFDAAWAEGQDLAFEAALDAAQAALAEPVP